MAHESDVNCVQFHPLNPELLASCSDDGLVKLWKVDIKTLASAEEVKSDKK
jgi:WD40 repeat protein